MSSLPPTCRAAAFAGFLACSVSAQSTPAPGDPVDPAVAQGLFSAWPVALTYSVAGGEPLLAPIAGPLRGAPAKPTFDPNGSLPDYSFGAMFPHLSVAERQHVRLDGASSGNALVPPIDQWTVSYAVPGGAMQPDLAASNRWLALSMSVTAASPATQNPLIPAGHDGSDIVSYFFTGSGGIPQSFVGARHLEQSQSQLHIPAGSDIGAFDLQLGVLLAAPDLDLTNVAPNEGILYFSVALETAQALAGDPLNGVPPVNFAAPDLASGATLPADAATIYRMEWQPTGNASGGGAWTLPVVHLGRADLGLTSHSQEDVDALTVDEATGIVIYSTTRASDPSRDQIRIYHPCYPLIRRLVNAADQLLDDLMGIDQFDDVDGLCSTDPEVDPFDPPVGLGTARASVYPKLVAVDPILYAGYARPMGLSVVQEPATGTPGNIDFRCRVSGWGALATPVDSTLLVRVAMESLGNGILNDDFTTYDIVPRATSEDVVDINLAVPPSMSGRRLAIEVLSLSTNQWIDVTQRKLVPPGSPNATYLIGATAPVEIEID